MFAVTDDNMAEGDKLTVFLNSCLKQTKHVTEVKKKLDDEGIDYDTLYDLGEQDLRCTLKDDLGIKNYQVGLIVKRFRAIDGSGCKEHPAGSGTSGFVILTEKHNKYLLNLQENVETVKKNIDKLEVAADDINKNKKTVTSEINQHYKSLSGIMQDQQTITLKKLETVTNGKLSMIKSESVVANEALQHLEKSDENFKRLLNDKKLDITKKHGAVTQHIDASQVGLVKYEPYLDKDMSLPTQTKIEYAANETQAFKAFMEGIDNIIDADISFTKIEFTDNGAVIAWKSDLDEKENAKFMLQFRTLNESKDDEKKPEYEWSVLQILKPKQSQISLDVEIKEEVKEEKKDDEKDDTKNDNETGGRLGVLKGLTMYQFRILVSLLTNKMYSRVLTVKTPQFKRLESVIIKNSEERQLMQWISDSGRCKLKLLFRASRDGFAAAEFHKKCDGIGTTLTIVKSTNNDHVFGGYTEIAWDKSGSYKRDDNAWLFSIRNTKNTPQKFRVVKNQTNATYCVSSQGPSFGSNHDLCLVDKCDSNNSSYTHLGGSYEGGNDKYQLNGGKYNFKVNDYEVFEVLDLDRGKTIQSKIINEAETKQLMKWFPNAENIRFRLAFNTKVDGFGGSTFHSKCNGISPTITIAQSTNNHVFGGYVEKPWKSDNNYARDDNAWLYSLRNAKGNVPKKFDIFQNQTNAMYNHQSYGPSFGSNHDLHLANACNGNTSSYTNLGGCFRGAEDPYQLTGQNSFQVKDYEVWELIDPGSSTLESNILNKQETNQLMQWVKESGNTHYKLLLRGSVDGFRAATFHQKCDDKGRTLVIIRSETNYIFGGYTEASWKHKGYVPDTKAFVYLLKSANGDQPEKWMATKNNNSICANNSHCASFGSGHDIYMADACNANTSSYSNFGSTYSGDASKTKLAGAYNFKVTEYEVWRVC